MDYPIFLSDVWILYENLNGIDKVFWINSLRTGGVYNWVIIGSGNGFSLVRRQTIAWMASGYKLDLCEYYSVKSERKMQSFQWKKGISKHSRQNVDQFVSVSMSKEGSYECLVIKSQLLHDAIIREIL